MVDYNGLENRRTERYRGFESLSLRKEQSEWVALFSFWSVESTFVWPIVSLLGPG